MVATRPMTPARLRALTVLAAIAALGVGGIAGQVTRRNALFQLRDVTWGYEEVTVAYRSGNAALPVVALVAVLAGLAVCLWLGARFAARRSFADPDGARRWMTAAAGVWLLGAVGAAVGWTTTTAADGIRATSVADFVRDRGDEVDAVITSGERRETRPGGGGGVVLSPPLTVEFTLDGVPCSLSIDDPLVGDGDSLALTPFCPDAPRSL